MKWRLRGRGRGEGAGVIREKSVEGRGRIPSPNVRVTWSAAQPPCKDKTQRNRTERPVHARRPTQLGQRLCFGGWTSSGGLGCGGADKMRMTQTQACAFRECRAGI